MYLFDRCAATNRWARWPPGDKVAFALLVLAVVLIAASPLAHLVILLILVALLVVGAGIAVRDLALAASIPLGFLALGGLAQLAVLDPAAGFPWLAFTNVDLAVRTLARSFAALAALMLLALTTPLAEVLAVLRRWGVPAVVVDVALLMLRLVRLTIQAVDEGRRAQAQRLGYVGYRRSVRSAGMLGASLLPRILERGRRLEIGLALRGYDGSLRPHAPAVASGRSRRAAGLALVGTLALAAFVLP